MRAEELDDSLLVLQARHEHVEVHPVNPLDRQPDMTADDLGHALCYHLPGSGRAGFASRRRLDRSSVLETGLTRARHEPAIGATKIHTPRRSEAKPHQLFLSMIFSENRYPPSDQVRGHAFPDHALAATGRAHCNSISSFPLS